MQNKLQTTNDQILKDLRSEAWSVSLVDFSSRGEHTEAGEQTFPRNTVSAVMVPVGPSTRLIGYEPEFQRFGEKQQEKSLLTKSLTPFGPQEDE